MLHESVNYYYSVPHEEKQKSFFYILVYISGTKSPMIMLQVPLLSSILTEHPGSYGFASRDVGVSQHGGVSHQNFRYWEIRFRVS